MVTLSPRRLCVLLCLAASGCLGGPTSDWPPRDHDDGTKSPPSQGGGPVDAGRGVSAGLDAGVLGTGAAPCVTVPTGDGGTDAGVQGAGVGDPVDPSHPFDDEPALLDAGCR